MTGKVAESFEELLIYQRARELTNGVYKLSRNGAFAGDFGLANQIRRAAVSVMSNIAEGFERGAKTEFIQFLFIAKGSCGEVRAQLQIAVDQNYISEADYLRLNDLCRRISGMISKFIAHLQASKYQGEKFSRPARLANAKKV
jgi:four helix bundle protein